MLSDAFADEFLVFADTVQQDLYKFSLRKREYTKLGIPRIKNPIGVAHDVMAGKLYWSDVELAAIMRSNFDGSHPKTVLRLPESNLHVASTCIYIFK